MYQQPESQPEQKIKEIISILWCIGHATKKNKHNNVVYYMENDFCGRAIQCHIMKSH